MERSEEVDALRADAMPRNRGAPIPVRRFPRLARINAPSARRVSGHIDNLRRSVDPKHDLADARLTPGYDHLKQLVWICRRRCNYGGR